MKGRRTANDDLGLGGGRDGLGLVHPGRGVHGHAPVAPGADLHVLGCQLNDVLLPGERVRDGVSGSLRQLHLESITTNNQS